MLWQDYVRCGVSSQSSKDLFVTGILNFFFKLLDKYKLCVMGNITS